MENLQKQTKKLWRANASSLLLPDTLKYNPARPVATEVTKFSKPSQSVDVKGCARITP